MEPSAPTHQQRRLQRILFALQILVGMVGGAVVLAPLLGVYATSPDLQLMWVFATVALLIGALWWLEKRKYPPQIIAPADYAARLTSLTESRREIVAAFEIERRRIERDLHDGTQQFLVASAMKLGEADMLLESARDALAATPPDLDRASVMLGHVAAMLTESQKVSDDALTALRRTVSGIHPKVLSDLGLEVAIRDMVERSGLNVRVVAPHTLPEMPEGVLAAAYFFAAEAVTNIAKYAPGAAGSLLIAADQSLHITVMDEGPGGAVIRPGGGLSGLRERLAAFGGTLELSSPAGGPTTVSARIPLLLEAQTKADSSSAAPQTAADPTLAAPQTSEDPTPSITPYNPSSATPQEDL